jgi:hypothetical protein
MLQRPAAPEEGAAARDAWARVVADLPEHDARRVLSEHVDMTAHLKSDERKSLLSIGEAFATHNTVRHSELEYACGVVLANLAEGFNDRVWRDNLGERARPSDLSRYSWLTPAGETLARQSPGIDLGWRATASRRIR